MDGTADAPIRYPWPDAPLEGEAVELAEGALWMRLPLPMALDHVNIFALDEGDHWSVVDTGFASRRTRGIWEALEAGPLKGKPVGRVILTHHHPDHVGLAGWFQERGATLAATRVAWLTARMLTLDEQDLPSAESVAFWRASGMDPEILTKRLGERPFNFADCVAPLPLGYTRLAEGDVLRAGGRDWEIHLGQGHAPDHATLWSRDDPLVIGGDQLLPSISPNLGVYPTEPDADPVGEWLESCTRLSALAREDQIVLPGHKLPFTGLPARMGQLIDNHIGALDRLREWLTAAPRTAHECFAPLYRREIGSAEYGLALVEAVGHLNHLLARGDVLRDRRDDGAWLWRMTD
ncbi:MAG: MBL fold metallo-hydrolase [Pseudomonadota bacterium]